MILTSRTLGKLSAPEERHFVRLLLTADDFGRFESDTQVLRGRLYPMLTEPITDELVEAWTRALVDAGLIQLYHGDAQGERRYGHFINWEKHNKIRAASSLYPDPETGHICANTCKHVQTHVGLSVVLDVVLDEELIGVLDETPSLRDGSDPRASNVPQNFQEWKARLFQDTNRKSQVAVLIDMCRSLTNKPIDGGLVASLINDRNGDVERVLSDLWHSIADNPDGDLVLYTKGKAKTPKSRDGRVPAHSIFRRTANQ